MHKSGFGLLALVLVANVLIVGDLSPLLYISVAFCHEIGHLLCFKVFCRKISFLQFVGFGIKIESKSRLSYREETTVALAGPILNVLLGCVFIALHCYYHRAVLLSFSLANFSYALLNLLPLSPLDGYKVLKDIILYKLEYQSANRCLFIIHIASMIMITITIALLIIYKADNISLLCIMFVLLLNAVTALLRHDI